LILPSKEKQNQLVGFLNCQTSRIEVLISKIREAIIKLQEFRAALISAAVTGKIDVREASL
jgi:type I restriction enzyme S subunit